MSSFPPEGKGAALVGFHPCGPEKRRPALLSLTPLLAAACALFSVDSLIEARYGDFVYYRHDYGPANSAKIIEVMKNEPRARSDTVTGPCITTLRGRLRSRMLVIAHDGVCVDVFTEILWYRLGRLEVEAGLESPPHEPCP